MQEVEQPVEADAALDDAAEEAAEAAFCRALEAAERVIQCVRRRVASARALRASCRAKQAMQASLKEVRRALVLHRFFLTRVSRAGSALRAHAIRWAPRP